jgi:hypothetical protein
MNDLTIDSRTVKCRYFSFMFVYFKQFINLTKNYIQTLVLQLLISYILFQSDNRTHRSAHVHTEYETDRKNLS